MNTKVVIVGAGGCGRDVLEVLEACATDGLPLEVLGFIVDAEYGAPGDVVNGLPILGGLEWLRTRRQELFAICAVGDPVARQALVSRVRETGVSFCNAIHPRAVLSSRISLGVGVVIPAGCVLTGNVRIGDHVHLNVGCTLSHDVRLNDYVTISPGVHVAGNVEMGTGCFVGTGASIIEKVRLGAWSIVGAGAAVLRDVPPDATAVGVPARIVKVRSPPTGAPYAP